MNFETALSDGNFCIPKCTSCKKKVWSPSEFCNKCFGDVELEKWDGEGKIIEFSKKEEYFCLIEIEETIRILAKIKQTPKIGQRVKILNCGITNDGYFFEVT